MSANLGYLGLKWPAKFPGSAFLGRFADHDFDREELLHPCAFTGTNQTNELITSVELRGSA